MKTKTVKKLWQGRYVSVRDYEIKSAIRQGGLRITHNNEIMDLKPEELSNLKPNNNVIQSQYNGSYRLVDITFKPLTEDPRQRKML
jgi:hypothetical protein